MVFHYIAIASHYADGNRIGWHYASNDSLEKNIIRNFLDKSQEVLGTLDFGIHRLSTEDLSWESVVKKDSFFEDVLIIDNQEEFLQFLVSDKKLTAHDIANFFLSMGSISNLKLQKLIYFAYETFLKRTGKKLFNDPIVAYKYGPVVEGVYFSYKGYGRAEIEDDVVKFRLKELTAPIVLAKISLSDMSKIVIDSLLETIEKYWDKTAGELVDLSHIEGGPWDTVYVEGKNKLITDDIILKFHN